MTPRLQHPPTDRGVLETGRGWACVPPQVRDLRPQASASGGAKPVRPHLSLQGLAEDPPWGHVHPLSGQAVSRPAHLQTGREDLAGHRPRFGQDTLSRELTLLMPWVGKREAVQVCHRLSAALRPDLRPDLTLHSIRS